MKMRSKYNQ